VRNGKNSGQVSGNSSWRCLELLFRNNETDGKNVVSVMGKRANFHSRNFSRSILSHLWNYQVRNTIVLFLKSNEYGDNDLHGSYCFSTRQVLGTEHLVSL
jgi:hypothetical protein